MTPTPEDLLNQAKTFVELHTKELANWKKRVEELTGEVEKAVKAAVQPEEEEEKPKAAKPKKKATKSSKKA